MLTRLQHGRTVLARLAVWPSSQWVRRKVTAKPKTATAKSAATNAISSDIAKKLDKTGVWKAKGGRKKADAPRAVDPRRVNVVSEGLCGTSRGRNFSSVS